MEEVDVYAMARSSLQELEVASSKKAHPVPTVLQPGHSPIQGVLGAIATKDVFILMASNTAQEAPTDWAKVQKPICG
ncbi:MAG: hypothetical protein M1823_009037, partial [Watsoniomyces obsoletus]